MQLKMANVEAFEGPIILLIEKMKKHTEAGISPSLLLKDGGTKKG